MVPLKVVSFDLWVSNPDTWAIRLADKAMFKGALPNPSNPDNIRLWFEADPNAARRAVRILLAHGRHDPPGGHEALGFMRHDNGDVRHIYLGRLGLPDGEPA